MITYPNQRIVTVMKTEIERAKKKENQMQFLQIRNDVWQAAASNIKNSSAFKLYLYFASNRNGYSMALSAVAVQEAIGISENTYRAAFKELVELGYITAVEGKKNQYNFHDSI